MVFKALNVRWCLSKKEIRYNVKSGLNKWITADNKKEGNTLFAIRGRTPKPTKISSHYYWAEKNKLVMTLKYVENVHADIFTFTFSDKGLELGFNNSLEFQPNNREERKAIGAFIV